MASAPPQPELTLCPAAPPLTLQPELHQRKFLPARGAPLASVAPPVTEGQAAPARQAVTQAAVC
eukprot:CAMPEP_0206148364 /NCGR_PEP_ID=MMETSP1473-20131121/36398_1 /ASSEMBLY_ACC=CAM_ASM_001109 /TAXON_ID=1461547 /ORGANISM="Stichococcus sp, Strain RCC1054" /LENGTH=63 /DNA_ID=CAMNT_0053545673 /DNA_START=19 /DNA_END=210 /DNA_ORIENTATION=+